MHFFSRRILLIMVLLRNCIARRHHGNPGRWRLAIFHVPALPRGQPRLLEDETSQASGHGQLLDALERFHAYALPQSAVEVSHQVVSQVPGQAGACFMFDTQRERLR
ncbi:hypothetical protein F4778DRAFT_761820 [Xylariomycetidae sp. FL2044]|nr:hypothetical protein F4778DRAFT_761820 [Xylariomycetidae sp. FL2044]